MVFVRLHEELRARGLEEQVSKVITVGVIGNQGAGKTYFNNEFADYLSSRGVSATEWNCDMYTRNTRDTKRQIISDLRDKDPEWVEKAFYQYDKDLLLTHLKNLKARKSFQVDGLYDQHTGEKDLHYEVEFCQNGKVKLTAGEETQTYAPGPFLLLLDSDFITEDRFREHLDLVVFLEAKRTVRMRRARRRCLNLAKPFELDRDLFLATDNWLIKYFEQQETPREGDIVVDNNNYRKRKILQS